MGKTYNPYYPCLLVVQEDTKVIGQTRQITKAHDWNNDMAHIADREIIEVNVREE